MNLTRQTTICLLLIFVILFTGCRGLAYRVPTEGMEPTIGPYDLCLANPFTDPLSGLERFDIVVFTPNSNEGESETYKDIKFIQRIVGLSDETVEIRNNVLLINGKITTEPFEKMTSNNDRKNDFGPFTVPSGEYFLLGDNRPNSLDSRHWERPTIHGDKIHSKIVTIKKDYYKK